MGPDTTVPVSNRGVPNSPPRPQERKKERERKGRETDRGPPLPQRKKERKEERAGATRQSGLR